jgi:hypothetical protein
MSEIDNRILAVQNRIKELKIKIPAGQADAQIAADAYHAAMRSGDSAGADINRNSNIKINGETQGLMVELSNLEKELVLLFNQKTIQQKAQQKQIETALTSTQKKDIELANIASNDKKKTAIYIIVGVVVVAVLVFVYFKFIK